MIKVLLEKERERSVISVVETSLGDYFLIQRSKISPAGNVWKDSGFKHWKMFIDRISPLREDPKDLEDFDLESVNQTQFEPSSGGVSGELHLKEILGYGLEEDLRDYMDFLYGNFEEMMYSINEDSEIEHVNVT